MDRVGVLCGKDRAMLYEFSRRSLDRLGGRAFHVDSLPFFSVYYEANVKKEAEKDRLIIEEAARSFESGSPACELDLEDLFEKTKAVDRAFLSGLPLPSFSLTVRYGDIADIRIRRIWLLSQTVYGLLEKWRDSASFADAARSAYSESEFRNIVMDILRLYSQETRMLSRSVKLPPPLGGIMTSLSELLFQAMEEVAEDIAGAYVDELYGDKTAYA
jgi:hypothetical protein